METPNSISTEVSRRHPKSRPNIHSNSRVQTMQLSSINEDAIQKQEEEKKMFNRQKKARNIVIPVEDLAVKIALREIGHPICLFGEIAQDRRER